jgi:hypothetical protein
MLKNPHEDVVGGSLVESPWTRDNDCLNASAADRRLVHSKKIVDKAGYGNPLAV